MKSSINFRRIFLIMAFTVFKLSAFAQTIFNGVVSDDSGEKIPGAYVRVKDGSAATVSDANGAFSIKSSGDTCTVIITHLSYETKEARMNSVNANLIIVSKRAFISDEVNIIATRVDDKTGAAYQNISKGELEKNNLGQDLPYLLNYTPSVVTTSDAGSGVGYSGIRIRGSDGTRVNVTINGVPVNDAESHQVYWVDLPDLASSVDNIQIQRGVGSSTNGSGAFGGSVNIQTNTVANDPYATLSSSAGSFKTFKNTVSFGSGLINKTFAVEGRLSKISSDGYMDRSSSDLKSFYLSGGFYGKKNSLRAVILSGKERTDQAWYGVPQDSLTTNRKYNSAGEYTDATGRLRYYDNQTDNYQQDYYQLLYTHEFNSKWNVNGALHYTRGKGYYEEFKEGASLSAYNLPDVTIGDSTISNTNIVRQLWLSNDFYGATWSLQYRGNNLTFIAGGAGNEYKGLHYGEVKSAGFSPVVAFPFRYYTDKATKKDYNTFIKVTYYFQKGITGWIDLQRRDVSYGFSGPDDSYINSVQNVSLVFYNPKAGLNYQLNEHQQVYVTLGMAHKEPVRDDYLSSTPANRPKAEKMSDLELGYRFQKKAYRASVNGYYMKYDNQLILNGKINSVGEYIRESVPNSFRYGVEGESSYDNGKMFAYNVNLTLSRNLIAEYTEYVDDYDGGPQIVNTYDTTTIAFSPSVIAGAIVTIRPVKHFSVDVCGKYVGKQYLDNTTNETRKLDGYLLNDVRLSYTLNKKKVKSIEFRLTVNNIFNRKYISNGYTYSGFSGGERYDYNYYYPQAGINFLGGISIKI